MFCGELWNGQGTAVKIQIRLNNNAPKIAKIDTKLGDGISETIQI